MKVQTVTDINKIIKKLIETNFVSPVSVRGELSNFSISPTGHSYFVLKDENSKIKAVMFKGYMNSLLGYNPQNGDKVIVTGDIKTYEPEGTYQIIVKKMLYDSIGDFYKKFEEIKKKLESEGLFDKDKKKQINRVITNIALITSPHGAAIKDFLITLENNNIGIDIDFYPVQVQSESAVSGIIKAISIAGSKNYDALILMRGGGSIEDLSVFNDEFIARALFSSKVPTISAIGHERDYSICDFVADVRVATPTASAEFIIEKRNSFLNEIKDIENKIGNIIKYKILNLSQYLDTLFFKIEKKSPLNNLKIYKQELNNYNKSIELITFNKLDNIKSILFNYCNIVKSNSPLNKIDFFKEKLKIAEESIINSTNNEILLSKNIIETNFLKISQINIKDKYKIYRQEVINIENKLNSFINLWQKNIKNQLLLLETQIKNSNYLDKGYALVQKQGKHIESVKNIKLEDILEIRMKDGYITTFVDGIKKDV